MGSNVRFFSVTALLAPMLAACNEDNTFGLGTGVTIASPPRLRERAFDRLRHYDRNRHDEHRRPRAGNRLVAAVAFIRRHRREPHVCIIRSH